MNEHLRIDELRHTWFDVRHRTYTDMFNEIISQEKEMIKAAVHDAVFKMYCPLVADGVDKEILKRHVKEVLDIYEIEHTDF